MALYDPPKTDVNLAIFDRAADALDQRGWCQNTLFGDRGRTCLIGSLLQVTHSSSITPALLSRLGFPLGPAHAPARNVVAWNDECGRTKAEVIDRLRRAARGEFV